MDNSIPLTEKYRPNILSDLIYQEDIVKLLNSSYQNNSMPHLLFHGPLNRKNHFNYSTM